MKILQINKFFYLKGGAEVSFFETAKLLANKGHKVIFFSMKHPRNISSEYEKYFVSNVDYEKSGFKNVIISSINLLYSFEAKRKIEKLIEKEIPHISSLMYSSIKDLIHYSDVIIVGNKVDEFKEALKMVKESQVVIDLVRIVNGSADIEGEYYGICW